MVSPANMKYGKGWFIGVGRDGDRTLDQQLTGLEQVLSEVAGKTVIDVGCAEGLITIAMAKAGATNCLGIEVVPGHVVIARDLAAGLPCRFMAADLNTANLSGIPKADIVLMLAVLHKLKDPSAVCATFANLALDLCVVRLPPSGPVILDHRSEFVSHDIVAVMANCGMGLESVVDGPFGEWTGYFRRPGKRKSEAEMSKPKVEPATEQAETTQPEAAPTPPLPADELKVDAADDPVKIEGGQQLFPTIGRRGHRNDGKVQADPPKSDESK